MKPTDSAVFSQMMALMAEIYGKACTEPFVNIYWHLLKDFDLSDIRKAFKAHINNPDGGQFFPKPADLIRVLEGSAQTRALQAWSLVERAMREIGSYQSLAFEDYFIHAVIEEMGGWIKLCTVSLKELPFVSLEFQRRYQGFVIKAPQRHPPYLCGIIEQDNAKEGYPLLPPLLVGDPKKVQTVIATGGEKPLLVQRPQSIQDLIKAVSKAQQDPTGDNDAEV